MQFARFGRLGWGQGRGGGGGDPTALTPELLTALGITTTRTGAAQGHLLATSPGQGFEAVAANEPIFERGTIAGIPVRGLLVQGASNPLVTRSNDLSNAVWTKTNATVEQQASGGVADAPWSLVTGTAANWSVTRTLTRSSAVRKTRWRIEAPETNVGDITVSHNGGSTRITVTPGSFQDIALAEYTGADPTFELRGTNSGDTVRHYDVQHEESAAGIPAFKWHPVQGASNANVGAGSEFRTLALAPTAFDVSFVIKMGLVFTSQYLFFIGTSITANFIEMYFTAPYRAAIRSRNNSGTIFSTLTANNTFSLGETGLIRLIFSGTTFTLYLDGNQVAQITDSQGIAAGTPEFHIGNRIGAALPLHGDTPVLAFRDTGGQLLGTAGAGWNIQALEAYEASLL
jgi:hypothetical protein